MSIRLKIGLGFAALILILTTVVGYWGARSLGISIETSDSAKLEALREELLRQWSREQAELQTLARQISQALAPLLSAPGGRETALLMAERLRTQVRVNWIEILQDGKPWLYPGIVVSSRVGGLDAVPGRLTEDGPLSGRGFLIARELIPGGGASVMIARLPNQAQIPLACLWDNQGVLAGSEQELSLSALEPVRETPFATQLLLKGRLYRVRMETLAGNLRLLVGYEADAAVLTRAGVNDLMVQMAILQVAAFLFLGFFLGRRLFRPLEELRSGIEKVASGHWQEIPGQGEDELGKTAQSFNHMVRELGRAQERLLTVQKELLAREKMALLGRFSAGVAHEINNPLGTILVSAGMAKETLEEQGKVELEDLQNIIDETKRCRGIVESLLRFARNRPPETCPVPLLGMIQAAVDQVKNQEGFQRVTVQFPLENHHQVVAEAAAMVQVLRNLLANAMEAVCPVADPRVQISLSHPEKDWICLEVADNGPAEGWSEEHLFEPFFTTKSNGTGLGLAISQSIVEGHGGRLWAERTPDGWTRFRLTLPLVPNSDHGTVK